MPIRKTESRISAGLQPADPREPVISAEDHSCLISFITGPLATERENTYVVLVTDAGLPASVESFE